MAPALIYLDNNATTPMRAEVRAAMEPFLGPGGTYGNPSSLHGAGQQARAALESARERVAAFLGAAHPDEIVFTSGGTEADNLAVLGAAFAHREEGRHILVSAVEHHAVLHAARYLSERHGFEVGLLPVDGAGRVRPAEAEKALRPDTVLVAVMWANNEIGAIQPIREIGELCRARRVLFHTDAVQAAGKLDLDLKREPVDSAAVSGHKLYGPKGIGALYIRRGVRLQALQHGGAQERNRRAGTENVAGAAGLGAACEAAGRDRAREEPRIRALRDRLETGLLARIPESRRNGPREDRLGNTSNLSFACVEGESLVLALDQAAFTLKDPGLPGIAASTGAACSAGLLEPSHVLKAIGLPPEEAQGGVRFSLGRFNTEDDVVRALEIVPRVVERLRGLSPLWEDRHPASRKAGRR